MLGKLMHCQDQNEVPLLGAIQATKAKHQEEQLMFHFQL